jgi:hypothetical protein
MAGIYGKGFTLNELAVALRGMPRDGHILIKLPSGKLVEIDHVTGSYVSEDLQDRTGASATVIRYAAVLVAEG